MQYKDMLKEISHYLMEMNKEIPETMKGFRALTRAGKTEGFLDKKTKELIALAIGIGEHCEGCIAFHTKALVDLGISREAFMEMLSVVIYMGGGPAMMYAAQALKAFEEFSE